MIGTRWRVATCTMITVMAVTFQCRAEGGAKHSPAAVMPSVASASSPDTRNDDRLRWELAHAVSRLQSVEGAIAKSAERADQVARRTFLYSLCTVVLTSLLTAAVSLFAQSLLMRHQRKIHRADTEAKVANSYIEWQLKQLSELYGPVRALLGQSNALYRQMNKALVAADGTCFQLIDGQDFDNKEFQIRIDEQWTRFRTVQHLTEVYGKSYGVEPYFDDVVDVGARLAELIREKAGLARHEDKELIDVMGEYLAHYLVLKRLHERVKKGDVIHLNAVEEQAVFPVRLQQLVDNGFQSINKQVLQWRGLSKT